MTRIGIVAIGRNEGERLRRCLESVVAQGAPAVYVDSNSTDDSIATATSRGVEVVELDMSTPFSAARARNTGFERLLKLNPELEFVMFVDGDCEVDADWLNRAVSELDKRQDAAVACGRNRERFPEASIYNWMCDLEWNTEVGEAKQCGGNAVMRVTAFRQANGFDPSIKCGEEPELCRRMREDDWKIIRIDAEMTLHDAAMTCFRHFWIRQIRTGYGGMDVVMRYGMQRYKWINRSARTWGLWVPVFVIAATVSTGIFAGPWIALATFAGGLALFPLQALRIGMGARKKGYAFGLCLKLGWLTVIGKIGQVYGQAKYLIDHYTTRQPRLIEYKTVTVKPKSKTTVGQ